MSTHPGKILALLSAIALLAACGGGSSHGGGATPPINSAPVASFTATPAGGAAPLTVQFDASASSDHGGSIATYAWNFGDNTAAGSGVTTSHVYQTAGTVTATLTVTDNLGALGTYSVQLTLTPQSPIGVTVTVTNAVGGLVGDSVSVLAVVQSTYAISGVVATIAERQTALTYDPQQLGFVGTQTLAGVPNGRYTLTVRATDVHDSAGEGSAIVTHDVPPALTVVQPMDLSVALPDLSVNASCTDDLPGCEVEVVVSSASSPAVTVKSAPSALYETLNLSQWVGQTLTFIVQAKDKAGQLTKQSMTIYVEDGARLTRAADVPGQILDFDGRRLLYMVTKSPGDKLAIYDQVTGLTEQIPVPAAWPGGQQVDQSTDRRAYLTPSGAVFAAKAIGSTDDTKVLLLWHGGTLTEVALAPKRFAASGNYAVYNGFEGLKEFYPPGVYRLDGITGATSLVHLIPWVPIQPTGGESITADGTIVVSEGAYELVRDRAGQQTVLLGNTGKGYFYPIADGDDVIYTEGDHADSLYVEVFQMMLLRGGSIIQLAPARDWTIRHTRPQPFLDYQISDGWVAFVDFGTMGQKQVFSRSPQGTVTLCTDRSTDSEIDRLNGIGELMVINGSTRFFSRGSTSVAISGSAGKSYWFNGTWYLATGRELLAVNTG